MKYDEKLDFLINTLISESKQYQNIDINKFEDKRVLLRSLMNARLPKSISKEFLDVQNDFLRDEVINKGVVKLNDIKTIKEEFNSKNEFASKISIWQGDITRLQVGAIVNAANSQMLGCFIPCHKCIDNAIHSVAGVQLREVCNEYMQQKRVYNGDYVESTGSAMLTKAFNLPSEYVLHTVGPIVGNKLNDSLRQHLKNCYKSCLTLALEKGIKSIAFCCISTGEFRFPNEEAAKIAFEAVKGFMKQNGENFDRIIFNVFKDVDYDIYKNLL
ncbi:protein-ADP-ribose hydrolase [Clostridium grantii]|uniref:O-acetyl-ADP-ribose deacetylase (Regulator of RNase III), contains Macro domain n=1 Tax=Clostridium grantii DSM 8605 TaxID=1121316 RepID=A0A1M5XEL3_9CLOT|nr:protein-ADP-ribose hydrolase [Clostridium grantii]SHH98226.1 O-acetyl-ADP-ribose deacetylase (regulator of RNase III), contains Macro domain [Clostridium grantii DSM 8605]